MKEDQNIQMAMINRALGTFLMSFSVIIIFAIFFTETFIGKMTNLAAGLVIGLFGAILFFHAGKHKNPQENNQRKE